MKDRFQMSFMGELTFFLGLHVKQKKDGIFISQDKYVAEILRKFGLTKGKSSSTPIDAEKRLLKDPDGEDVDVHTYRSMISSLMYLTSSRPDIMFAVCACARFQVTLKALHLNAVKRIFRYLKGKPHLGLWYPKDSPFELVAYSDSDYAGASLDRKSTTSGCQFIRCRLISWQCKKQTVVATSSIEAEYVAAASGCAQVLWIQNQLLDYGYNFMHTLIIIMPMLVGNKNAQGIPTASDEFPLPEDFPTASEERFSLLRKSSYCNIVYRTPCPIKRVLSAVGALVIEFGDSYKAPKDVVDTGSTSEGSAKKKGRTVAVTTEDMQKRRNDVKARTTLLLALPDEHQLRFSKYKTAQELWAAILKTFEWLMYTIVWRNKSDLDTISLDDVYNHLKVYEPKVQKKSESNSQNMAFISSAKNNSGNGEVNTAGIPTVSTQVSPTSANVLAASISLDTACAYIASQSSCSQIKYEDINQIDEDDIKEMDIKDRAPRSQDRGRRENFKQGSKVEESAPKALMAIDGVGCDWSYMTNEEEDHALVADQEAPTEFTLMAKSSYDTEVFDNSLCSKACKKNTDSLNSKIIDLSEKLSDSKTMLYHYKLGLSHVEARLVEFKNQEIKFCEKIRGLEFKDTVLFPPPAQVYSPPKKDMSWTRLPEFTDDTITDYSRPSSSIESNLSNLSDYEPYDGGYVSFGQGGCKITGKGTIKTDESKLWHKRLGHLNFKTMNRLVRHNLVKGLPSKCFDNDHTFVACLKGKQHKASCKTKVLVNMSQNKTPYELFNGRTPAIGFLKLFGCHVMILNTLDHLGKFKAKGDEGYFIRYSMSSKAFRVFNKRTKRVEENLHVDFLENKLIEKGAGPNWLFDIDTLTNSMNYVPVVSAGTTSTNFSGTKDDASQDVKKDVSSLRYIALPNWFHEAHLESSTSNSQDACKADAPESSGNSNPTATLTNPPIDQMETLTVETPIPTVSSPVLTACLDDSPQLLSDTRLISKRVTSQDDTPSLDNILTLTNRFEDILGVSTNSGDTNGVEADLSNIEDNILVSHTPTLRIHKDHTTSQIIGPVDTPVQTRTKSKEMEEQSFIASIHHMINPNLLQFFLFSCFLSQEEPNKISDALKDPRPIGTKWVLKNKKDERGIVIKNKAMLVAQGHTQEDGIDYEEVFAPVVRIEAIRLFLAYASFMGFTVYQMDVKSAFLYGTIDEEVYVMQLPGFQDPDFPARVYKVKKAMYGLHQAPRAWYEEGWHFSLSRQGKDGTGKDVDLHLYRSMIRSLMYLTASRPDIMFAVCACARHQVTPKECHLHAVKKIFRYLKGHPKLGVWYPKDSPFDLLAYLDSDYGGATQDRKSTTGGCQFLGRRLISWQCKKQTIVATSTTEAEYVAAASGYGQVLWIQISCLIMCTIL
uniref:Uncharacterized mitochondrial protein AtMg00810-like n=1 Tax=Tanacetum cinerariifolium TaxID=118510 RepID=A0A6L2NZW6_TANCI|nr:uncharacterized mitochondrial protein AtMg00810-like [Tanacetum cinerariifolium]